MWCVKAYYEGNLIHSKACASKEEAESAVIELQKAADKTDFPLQYVYEEIKGKEEYR